MNKKRLFLISIFVVVGTLTIGSIVFSRAFDGSRDGRSEMAIDWLSSWFELTEGQKSKLLLIDEELGNLEKEFKKDRLEIKDEIMRMFVSDELDEDRILEIIEEKQKQVDYFAPRIIAEFAEFHESLSSEQRKKLADEIQKHGHTNSSHQNFHHRYH